MINPLSVYSLSLSSVISKWLPKIKQFKIAHEWRCLFFLEIQFNAKKFTHKLTFEFKKKKCLRIKDILGFGVGGTSLTYKDNMVWNLKSYFLLPGIGHAKITVPYHFSYFDLILAYLDKVEESIFLHPRRHLLF